MNKSYEKLNDLLNIEDQSILNELSGYQMKLNQISSKEEYILGFKLGVNLMVESLYNKECEIIEKSK